MKRFILSVCAMAAVVFSNMFLSGAMIAEPNISASTRYCGGSTFVATSEKITYSRKETTSQYTMKGEVPNYNGHVDAPNCANVAGAELIGYYDRFYEELIPDYKTYVQIGTMLSYRSMSAEISTVMITLKDYMGTDKGTTFNGFHKGMKKYVEKHSRAYITEDLGNLNFEKYKAAVEANKPVALFLSDYTFYLGTEVQSDGETIESEYSNVAHVVVGCGFKVDTYYNTAGQVIATRTYLRIASGFDVRGLTYLCLDGKSTVDYATTVIIS